MRAEFEFTVDDLVDLNLRVLDRSKKFQSRQWTRVITFGLLVGLGVFLMLPFSFGVKMASGAASLALIVVVHLLFRRREIGRSMRSLYLEKLGTPGPFKCEVELTEEGVIARQRGTEVKHSWAILEEIKETPDSIDFFTCDGGAVVVRDRAFNAPADKRRFFELAMQYWDSARKYSNGKTA
ncbi:MAG: YcxB family protein [Blastocatellia bacterium]